jgi:GNAT superfamily N-acetyltransferase
MAEATAKGEIEVPGAPEIEGLAFRHFRGDEDYPAILAVNLGSKIADGLEQDLHTLESITFTYGSTPNHDPGNDTLIAEVNGKMVGFNRVFWERELDGTLLFWHYGFILPEWRGKGLGRAMIGWVENRAREIARALESGGPAYASTEVFSTQPGLVNLLKEAGYEPVRYEFHMETANLNDIPDVPVPEGLEIRPVKPEDYHKVWAASVEAFRDHWGATEIDEADFERTMNNPLTDPNMWVVAWDGDEVAGSILNYINHAYNEQSGRKLGYTESISVRRPWRRKGLARAMLAASMRLHKSLGMTQTGLGVDTQNPSGALELYKSMGYEVVTQSTQYRKKL